MNVLDVMKLFSYHTFWSALCFLTVKIWPKGEIKNESFFLGSFKSPKVGLKKKSWGFRIWFSLFSQEYRRMI